MRREEIKVSQLTENFWLVDVKDNPDRPDITEQYQLVKDGVSTERYALILNDYKVATIEVYKGLVTARLESDDEIVYSAKVGNPGTSAFKTNSEREKLLKSAIGKVMKEKWWTKL